jgi:hypothetical protein
MQARIFCEPDKLGAPNSAMLLSWRARNGEIIVGTPSPSFCAADPVLTTVPEQLFGELTAELADLAELILRVALHVKINAVIADAVEVNRIAETFMAAAGCATDPLEQAKLRSSSATTVRDVHGFEMAETGSFPLSPQPNVGEDNAIAARLLELRDRLGGFIEPT